MNIVSKRAIIRGGGLLSTTFAGKLYDILYDMCEICFYPNPFPFFLLQLATLGDKV